MIRNWSTAVRRTVTAVGGLVTARPSRRRTAPVTYTLITLCCLLFLISPAAGLNPVYGTGEEVLAAQRAYFRRWGVIPAELFEDSPGSALTPATALFVHGSWVHLLGNMLFLYVFGAMTEERMGRLQFALFYLGCGYLALVGYAGATPTPRSPWSAPRGRSPPSSARSCSSSRGPRDQPAALPLLPAAALPGLGRAAVLGFPSVAGRRAGR